MKPKMEFDTASLAVIGVDIGKEVLHLVGLGGQRLTSYLCSALDIRLDFTLVQSVHAHAARDML
jgi:hypothetical protein